MDRLTFDGNFCEIAMCREQKCPYDGSCSQREVWERLKAYEDTGLEPEEIEKAMAISALREQEERENPTPLTLAELREMDGEPVWIKLFDPDEEFWVLRNDWVDTRNPEPMILLHGRWYLHDDYGKTWLAYRQKPKEV